jgi:hypothetical protein
MTSLPVHKRAVMARSNMGYCPSRDAFGIAGFPLTAAERNGFAVII